LNFQALCIFTRGTYYLYLVFVKGLGVATLNLFNQKQLQKELKKELWGSSLWIPSYFAGSCGGASLDIFKKYIEQQQRPM
jgi:REP element-mobilizing transposase RayT